jgi:type IV pilus assembly protein PilE
MTLMELLTVTVVLGILASIAVPSYRSYLIRSQRTDATAALLRVQAAEEKYYLSNNKYTSDVKSAPPTGLGLSDVTDLGFYSITVVPDTTNQQTYVATATPITGKGQSDDKKCTSFTISDTGTRGSTGPGGTPFCWR